VLALLIALTAAPADERIALVPLTSLGAAEEEVQAIASVLAGELQKLLGARLVDSAAMAKTAREAESALRSCEGDIGCLTELVGSLGIDAFVVGNVAGLGGERVINLKLYDARTGTVRRATSEPAALDQGVLVVRMRKAAVQLVAPELFVGTLAFVMDQPGLTILVDGNPVTGTRADVAVGRHAVEASGARMVSYSTLVDVGYGETRELRIHLAESTAFLGGGTPFRERWWTWSLAGAGVVGVGLGAYFNRLHLDGVRGVSTRAERGRLDHSGADVYHDAEDDWSRAKLFYGIGGVLATGAAAFLVVDFL
jgi:hypothetical protein